MRNHSRPQYHRIRRILEMIRQGTRTGKYPNATDFCRELCVTRRTILRDLDFLRSDEMAPVDYDDSRKGYWLGDVTWNLPPVSLSRKEVFAFSVARKLLDRFKGTALDMDMQSVLAKIGESLAGKVTLDLESMTDRFTVVGEDYVEQDPATWSEVARLLDQQEAIAITYEKFNGEVKKYRLEPYHLFAYHGNWYVLAQHVQRKRLATFAVSRIREIHGMGEHFDVPESFDPQEHIFESFGIVRGEKPFKVRLVFSKKVSGYIKERMWHPTQKMVQKRNGSVELSFTTAGWKELVRWILSWQPDVEVLVPKRLGERVREKMREGLWKNG